MSETKQLQSDIGFVRGVVREAERKRSPRAVYLLWAAIVFGGFALLDFAPRSVGLYWMIAAPAGFAISALLGWRSAERAGEVDGRHGMRHVFHWLGMMAVIFLAVPLAVTGDVPWSALNRIIVLIIAFTYVLAGVHLERPLAWIGALMVGCYLALFLAPSPSWTLLGGVVATGLVGTAVIGGPRHAARSASV